MTSVDRPAAMAVLGSTVRRLRTNRGISQEELADRAGLHRTYISSIERGQRNPALVSIIRLAQALGVDPSALLEDLDAPAS